MKLDLVMAQLGDARHFWTVPPYLPVTLLVGGIIFIGVYAHILSADVWSSRLLRISDRVVKPALHAWSKATNKQYNRAIVVYRYQTNCREAFNTYLISTRTACSAMSPPQSGCPRGVRSSGPYLS